MAPLIRAEARAVGQTLAGYLRHRGRYQAERDIHGVYRFLLKLASPDTVAQRLPRVVQQMLDFGQVESHLIESGHMEMRMSGFPAVLNEWYVGGFSAYADVALRLAGAGKVNVVTKPSEPDGDRDGIPLIVVRIEAWYD